jgi:hypothetical protein
MGRPGHIQAFLGDKLKKKLNNNAIVLPKRLSASLSCHQLVGSRHYPKGKKKKEKKKKLPLKLMIWALVAISVGNKQRRRTDQKKGKQDGGSSNSMQGASVMLHLPMSSGA